jgi:hypothetical protein
MSIPVAQVLSHWSTLIPFFNTSSTEFYQNLQKIVATHEMPNITMAVVKHKEKGILSASREYFRVMNKDLVFDICAAPYGKGFFVSSWLYETEGTMRVLFKNTKFGNFLQNRAARRTFYQADEEAMFKTTVHQCVLEVVDQITQQKGIRLTEQERQLKDGGS